MIGQLTGHDAQPSAGYRARVLAMLGSAAVHGALFALSASFGASRPAPRVPSVTEIAIETIAHIEREQPLRPEPVSPAPQRPVVFSAAPRRVRAERPAPRAPEPEQALAALPATAEAPADAESTIVSGTADAASASATSSEGAANEPAVVARPGAATRALVRAGASDGVDRSRAPRLAGTAEWRCAFPLEADGADVDRATVTLRVEIAPNGSVLRASPLDDPGHGFAREAQRCAQRKRWAPGLDRSGNPARATAVVRVSFVR